VICTPHRRAVSSSRARASTATASGSVRPLTSHTTSSGRLFSTDSRTRSQIRGMSAGAIGSLRAKTIVSGGGRGPRARGVRAPSGSNNRTISFRACQERDPRGGRNSSPGLGGLGALTELVALAFGITMIGAIVLKVTQWKTEFMAAADHGLGVQPRAPRLEHPAVLHRPRLHRHPVLAAPHHGRARLKSGVASLVASARHGQGWCSVAPSPRRRSRPPRAGTVHGNGSA
jgi:hypothetical protein